MNKNTNSFHIILKRLTEMEEMMEQMKEDLEEIKQNTARKKRKRIPLFSKRNKEPETIKEQMGTSGGDLPDVGTLLNHPMLKSFLQNKNGLDPNQLSHVLKNPIFQSILKNLT